MAARSKAIEISAKCDRDRTRSKFWRLRSKIASPQEIHTKLRSVTGFVEILGNIKIPPARSRPDRSAQIATDLSAQRRESIATTSYLSTL
ncbi:hypothetical protein [Chamaesiphon sp. OTE_75_metabat_556]|uniref:hypothetical protein n=1 Tax=Chamaesiphon sp. OTE_75_metabat_556 TaxID=2964692 RepID=UPI00286B589A|nr:hypothetical protein [Chamaesiphon sp. OTE_75_metabat_556]